MAESYFGNSSSPRDDVTGIGGNRLDLRVTYVGENDFETLSGQGRPDVELDGLAPTRRYWITRK